MTAKVEKITGKIVDEKGNIYNNWNEIPTPNKAYSFSGSSWAITVNGKVLFETNPHGDQMFQVYGTKKVATQEFNFLLNNL